MTNNYSRPETLEDIVTILKGADESLDIKKLAEDAEYLVQEISEGMDNLEVKVHTAGVTMEEELAQLRKQNKVLEEANESLTAHLTEVIIERNNFRESFEATLHDIDELQKELESSKPYISELEARLKDSGEDPYL